MYVILTAIRDWANHGYIMSKCLQSVGIDADMICTHLSKIDYGDMGILVKNTKQWESHIKKADVIIIMHSQFIGTNIDISKKKVLVFHTGTKYHSHSDSMNKKFAFVDVSLVMANIFDLGAKNEKYVAIPVDIDRLRPNYVSNINRFIAHYPTSPLGKGGSIIEEIVPTVKGRFKFDVDYNRKPWVQHIERVRKCDIYIEDIGLLSKKNRPKLGGMGLAAIEAAALGKVVITRMTPPYITKYEKELGPCGIQTISHPNELKDKLEYLLALSVSSPSCLSLDLSEDDFTNLKRNSREWVERIHSYEAVGKSFKQIIEDI